MPRYAQELIPCYSPGGCGLVSSLCPAELSTTLSFPAPVILFFLTFNSPPPSPLILSLVLSRRASVLVVVFRQGRALAAIEEPRAGTAVVGSAVLMRLVAGLVVPDLEAVVVVGCARRFLTRDTVDVRDVLVVVTVLFARESRFVLDTFVVLFTTVVRGPGEDGFGAILVR